MAAVFILAEKCCTCRQFEFMQNIFRNNNERSLLFTFHGYLSYQLLYNGALKQFQFREFF